MAFNQGSQAAPEPLAFAIFHHTMTDIQSKMEAWNDGLANWSSVIVTEFCQHIMEMPIPGGVTFEDAATQRADWVIHQWCQGRQEYVDRITGMLNPDTIVAANMAGMAGQLGKLIGLHLDNTLRELDAELREAIEEALSRRQPLR